MAEMSSVGLVAVHIFDSIFDSIFCSGAGNTGWDDQTHLWQNVIKDIKRSKLPAPHYRWTRA